MLPVAWSAIDATQGVNNGLTSDLSSVTTASRGSIAGLRIRDAERTVGDHVAEVGTENLRISLYLIGGAERDGLAEVEDDDAVGDPHDGLHVVLDQEDRQVELRSNAVDDLHE